MSDEVDKNVATKLRVNDLLSIGAVAGFSLFLYYLHFSAYFALSYVEGSVETQSAMMFLAALGAYASLRICRFRFRFFRGFRLYSSGGLVICLVSNFVLVGAGLFFSEGSFFGEVPLCLLYGLALGVMFGFCLQWWISIWSGLFLAGAKSKIFILLSLCIVFAAIIAFATRTVSETSYLPALYVFDNCLNFVSIAIAYYLLRFMSVLFAELSIDVELDIDRDTPRTPMGLTRPFFGMVCGVAAAVWFLWAYRDTELSSSPEYVVAMALVTGGGLCAITVLRKTLPRIERLEGIISFLIGVGCVGMLIQGDAVIRLVSLLCLASAIIIGVFSMIAYGSLLVPVCGMKPFEIAESLFSHQLVGLGVGALLVFGLALLNISHVDAARILSVACLIAFFADPLLFPHGDDLRERCHDYARNCDLFMGDGATVSSTGVNPFDPSREDGACEIDVVAISDEVACGSGENANKHSMVCDIIATRYKLTSRESEVLRLLGRGRSAGAVAEKLCVSYNTAKTHIYNIYKKLGISSRQELIDLIDTLYSEVKAEGQ